MRVEFSTEIIRTKYGIIVLGEHVPVDWIGPLGSLCGEDAVITLDLPNYYRCTSQMRNVLCVMADSKESHEQWRAEAQKEVDKIEDPHWRWWCGLDTGMSSKALFVALAKATNEAILAAHAYNDEYRSAPSDSGDFGRCFRLLKTFPEWRNHLNDAAKFLDATWQPIITAWNELGALYERRMLAECTQRIREMLNTQ